MFRTITITLFSVLALISLVQAENYAVLITGSHLDSTDGENLSWNGGNSDPGGFDEFWNDTFLMWEMLWQHGLSTN